MRLEGPNLSGRRRRQAITLLSAACLALVLVRSVGSALRFARERPAERNLISHSPMGEILTHRIQAMAPLVSDRMPLATIASAKVDFHAAAPYGVLLAVDRVILVLLLFAAGFLLHPYGGFIAAAAAAFLAYSAHNLNLYPDSGYLLLVLLTAGLVVWRARAPSAARSALLAAALGATMLWRSPLVFFGPVLALYEWAAELRFSWKENRRRLLILGLAPYLFLIPWIAMNWAVHRRVVILELRSASSNIVTGALGLVQNIEGDLTTLVDEPFDETNGGAVVGWAVRQVVRHPLNFARAYALRMKYALSFHPWIALFAGAGVWVFRKRREYRELALLAAYFLAIHCFMTVEERYFWPLWPVLALLAFSLPAGLRAGERPLDGAPEARFASATLMGALALVMALSVHAEWTVLSFARGALLGRGDVERQLSAALNESPGDAWLLRERAAERFRRGDFAGAADDFAGAAAREPESAPSRLLLARAEAIRGEPARLLAWNDSSPFGRESQLQLDAEILKGCAYLRLGRKTEALERLKAAWAVYRARNIVVRGPQGEREKRVIDKLNASDWGFVRYCGDLQGPRPDAEKRALNDALEAIVPGSSEVWMDRAGIAARAGRRAEALAALAHARSLAQDAEAKLRTAAAYRELKDYGAAAALLDALIRDFPADSRPRFERAELAAERGRRAEALEFLAGAEALHPGGGELRRALALHRRFGNGERVAALLDELIRLFPEDAQLRAERAGRAAPKGKDAAAPPSAAAPRVAAPESEIERRQRVGLGYQDRKEYGRALELFSSLAREYPAVAAFRSDMGLCEHLKGDDAAALADLAAAIRLEPKFLPAYLTAGAIHAAAGRTAEAAKVYDEALSRTADSRDPMRAAVLAARKGLRWP